MRFVITWLERNSKREVELVGIQVRIKLDEGAGARAYEGAGARAYEGAGAEVGAEAGAGAGA